MIRLHATKASINGYKVRLLLSMLRQPYELVAEAICEHAPEPVRSDVNGQHHDEVRGGGPMRCARRRCHAQLTTDELRLPLGQRAGEECLDRH